MSSVDFRLWEEDMKNLSPVVAVAAVLGLFGHATAEVYPTRAITMIAAGPAGGPTDAIGRIIAQRMRASLGQTVIIENVASSGGMAVRKVGRADPDGYTI